MIETIAGIAGAHAAALALHEHRFGILGHTLVGLIAGAASGYFPQVLATTTISGGGEAMPTTNAETFVVQALTGAVVGGMGMAVVGFIRYELSRR